MEGSSGWPGLVLDPLGSRGAIHPSVTMEYMQLTPDEQRSGCRPPEWNRGRSESRSFCLIISSVSSPPPTRTLTRLALRPPICPTKATPPSTYPGLTSTPPPTSTHTTSPQRAAARRTAPRSPATRRRKKNPRGRTRQREIAEVGHRSMPIPSPILIPYLSVCLSYHHPFHSIPSMHMQPAPHIRTAQTTTPSIHPSIHKQIGSQPQTARLPDRHLLYLHLHSCDSFWWLAVMVVVRCGCTACNERERECVCVYAARPPSLHPSSPRHSPIRCCFSRALPARLQAHFLLAQSNYGWAGFFCSAAYSVR